MAFKDDSYKEAIPDAQPHEELGSLIPNDQQPCSLQRAYKGQKIISLSVAEEMTEYGTIAYTDRLSLICARGIEENANGGIKSFFS